MSDIERRVEVLEEQVATLAEALETVTAWKMSSTSIRATDQRNVPVKITGQDKTKEILKRL